MSESGDPTTEQQDRDVGRQGRHQVSDAEGDRAADQDAAPVQAPTSV
jgi:hypothetical protein